MLQMIQKSINFYNDRNGNILGDLSNVSSYLTKTLNIILYRIIEDEKTLPVCCLLIIYAEIFLLFQNQEIKFLMSHGEICVKNWMKA